MQPQETKVVELKLEGNEACHFENAINAAKEELARERLLKVALLQVLYNGAGKFHAVFLLFNPLAQR